MGMARVLRASRDVRPFRLPPPLCRKWRFDSNTDATGDSLALASSEEEMRAIAVFAGVLVATPSMAADDWSFTPPIFQMPPRSSSAS